MSYQNRGVNAKSNQNCGSVGSSVMEVKAQCCNPSSLPPSESTIIHKVNPYIQRTLDFLFKQGVIRLYLSPSLATIWSVRKADSHDDDNLIVVELAKKAAVVGITFSGVTEEESVAAINIRESVDLKSAQQSDLSITEAIKVKRDKRLQTVHLPDMIRS